MKRGLGRTSVLALIVGAITLLNTGCLETIGKNALIGFGFSLGALPAEIVSDFLLGSFVTDGDAA